MYVVQHLNGTQQIFAKHTDNSYLYGILVTYNCLFLAGKSLTFNPAYESVGWSSNSKGFGFGIAMMLNNKCLFYLT